ncbi:Protein transport protein sec71 [Schizosaccharomyces pombe 972h-] [Rhizoctonia solani]|uniref:Protein transport protein sec71 [Schizosaccharomyces pombe 972h-] n=1 Tax=Rhizoctonia solani TaxID=456999 RepID=A0A0K6GG18_9AGAM|nr:Protein transport protein sec71 [Schizosaccharomyces pombe 972h-] [Rhizoctonia solani]
MAESPEPVSSTQAEPPAIVVEEQTDVPSNSTEPESNVETQPKDEPDNAKESVDVQVAPETADDTGPASNHVPEVLPETPTVNHVSAAVASDHEQGVKNSVEEPQDEVLDVSDASRKDLPIPPTDEPVPTPEGTSNEPTDPPTDPPVQSTITSTEIKHEATPTDLNPPEVVVRAPSTELSHTPIVASTPTSAVEPGSRPGSVPPPIPEKVKTPVDRSSAAGFSQHRNSSVSSVRTSTPGPGSRPSVSSQPDRRSSVASLASHRTNGSRTFVSPVFFTTALETIAASREAKRSAPFKSSVDHALELVKSGRGAEKPREIFEPLQMAVETQNEKLMITGLDCIAKLVSHGFFAEDISPEHAYNSPPASPAPGATPGSTEGRSPAQMPLADLITSTITAAYTDTTPDAVSLQIVKALLSLVLSPTILVHHSSLLKAVRTVYNVFLLSNDPVNQMVAQGGLTQMVNHVFGRCKVGEDAPTEPETPGTPGLRGSEHPKDVSQNPSATGSVVSLSAPRPPSNGVRQHPEPADADGEPAAPLNGGEEHVDGVVEPAEPKSGPRDAASVGSPVPRAPEMFEQPNPNDALQTGISAPLTRPISNNDLFIKDAFLVFRALCKLTMKPLGSDSERELKSHAMRSKLLSLHLVLTVLDTHMPLFVDPHALIFSSSSHEATPFLHAVKQYLCLALSRNAISSVPQVFDISVEIFWRILSGLRTKLKKEIEVLFVEIFIPIMEMRQATPKQKSTILTMFAKLCEDPQALVDIYLNYDCDRQAMENIYERLVNIISKAATSQAAPPTKGADTSSSTLATGHTGPSSMPPSLSTSALTPHSSASPQSTDIHLNRQGLECLVSVLKSLVTWGTGNEKVSAEAGDRASKSTPREDSRHDSINGSIGGEASPVTNEAARQSNPDLVDDPGKFESAKHRKTLLLEGIKKFNYKQKKGIQFLMEKGFIESKDPKSIARFLITTDGLSKAALGEYLGEGEEENIAIMHAFVDLIDFTGLSFVDALRAFLQSFRLPGEAQKIDRFMLKYAARYIAQNPQSVFKDADPAYVLAYSVIMLNTDAYNPQVKKRMTKADFIKNNRGINDGSDLPEEMLSTIYDDIQTKEIRMKDEEEAIALQSINAPSTGLVGAIANVGRDLAKETYIMQTTGMANKTEALLKTMMRSQRRGNSGSDQFFSASHFVHVRPMFEVAWMPFIAGLSTMQNTDDMEIACFFDLELERNAFVTTLAKFTFLNNLGEMKTKNMEAIKALLDVAVSDGNHLRGSWHEVLTCVSQLERMALIGSKDETRKGKNKSRKLPAEELANESRSRHITVAADMVFSLSHYLSGTAIQDFVQALSDVSWEEIQTSGLSEQPRLFSLQKLVDISYYNMNRIRMEWSNMWHILGEHFNRVCCHTNPTVSFFALDALRQLAARFLEKEELANFKFQKDFLKPFEYTMTHNHNPDARDLVLQCLQHMIQTRVQNVRSGWRTMFGVFAEASKVLTESVAQHAFEIVSGINKNHFGAVVRNGAFADLTVCITDFCKVTKFQKISLLAITMLQGIIPVMLNHPECGLTPTPPLPHPNETGPQLVEDPLVKFWFPVLFSFYNIIMEAEDLEVRKLALNSLFSSLKTYGTTFPPDFWDHVCQKLLFPIFDVLKNSQEMSRLATAEDMNIWVSTTMIQALRELVDLYTHFFELLARSLGGLLDLLSACICLKNDTISRIGTSCLQQLLEKNAQKLTNAQWDTVVMTFLRLFKGTTPHQLFDESLRAEGDVVPVAGDREHHDPEPSGPLSPLNNEGPISGRDRSRIFKDIIMKCVIQLLLIETTNDLLQNKDVYRTIPPDQLLKLLSVLDHSYQFARSFNADKELRTGLWKVGFMKHLPNLLKQESSSAACLINVSLRMYYDKRPEYQAQHAQVADRLMPLGLQIIEDFNALRAEGQGKNVATWTPVVAEILRGFYHFDDQTFARYLPALYPLATILITRDTAPEIRQPLSDIFVRVGRTKGITA